MKGKAGLRCVLWLLGATEGPRLVNTQRHGPAQAHGLAPLHCSVLCVSILLASLPQLPNVGAVFDSWLFSAVTNSSSACSLIPLSLSASPSLAVCLLAQPLRVGMLLLLSSLPFPSLVCFPKPTCSLLSSVISQPYGAMTVLSPPCPLEASSEEQPGTEYTSQPPPWSDFWSWASGVWEAAERKSTGSGVRHEFTPSCHPSVCRLGRGLW